MNDLRIQHVTFAGDAMQASFSDSRSVVVPLAAFPRLQFASPSARRNWQLIERGLGVHWDAIDEELSVENILFAYSRTKTAEYATASQG